MIGGSRGAGMDDPAGADLGGRDDTADFTDISATALLDTLPQPAFIADANHRVVGWNREMEGLTGVDRESVLGDDDADRADETSGGDRSGRDQRAFEAEQDVENAAGERLRVHSVATPLVQAGEVQGVVQDNTELVRRREAMADLVDHVGDSSDGSLDDCSPSRSVDAPSAVACTWVTSLRRRSRGNEAALATKPVRGTSLARTKRAPPQIEGVCDTFSDPMRDR